MKPGVFFFTDGAIIGKRGILAKMGEEINRRFESIRSRGVADLYVCEEAARKRGITEENLTEGITIIGYATFLDLATSAKTVITI